MYRQGDVLLVKINAIPEGAKLLENKERITIAWGEATGHSHALLSEHATAYEWQGDLLIEVKQTTQLTHGTHSGTHTPTDFDHYPITLEPGVYKYLPQREYTPEAIKRVVD